MTEIATLTAEQVAGVEEMLAAFDSPSKRAELKRRVAEIQEAARREEYEREIAASHERARVDPASIAARAQAAEEAKEARSKEIRDLQAMARTDTLAIHEEARRRGDGIMARWFCVECHQPTYNPKMMNRGAVFFCEACFARNRLRCGACGAHRDTLCTWCPQDATWRCEACLPAFLAGPPPKPQFLTPGVGVR